MIQEALAQEIDLDDETALAIISKHIFDFRVQNMIKKGMV